MAILTLAGLTLREASRRKLLITLALVTLIAIPLVAWGFSFIPQLCAQNRNTGGGTCRGAEAGMLILVAYMFSLIIAVAAPFMAAPAIAADVESHQILAILPRPVRRLDVVVGRWLGLAIMLTVYTALTCGLEFLAVDMAVGYSPPHPVLASLCIVGETVSLMTLALLGSTRFPPIACGILTFFLFGITWLIGVAGQVGAAFGSRVLANVGTVTSLILPTDGFWRGALFNMEPVSMLALSSSTRAASADPFVVPAPPTTAYVIWAIGWIFVVLGLAVLSFRSREV